MGAIETPQSQATNIVRKDFHSLFSLVFFAYFVFVCSINFSEIGVRLKFLKDNLRMLFTAQMKPPNKCILYQLLPFKNRGKYTLKIWS